jgi:flagellar biosynthesis protein FliR
VLAAAVFVGIDGHVAVIEAIVTSFRTAPAVLSIEPRVRETLAGLLPSAVQLAVPWLVTAAVVEIAAGVAVRVAGRASVHSPIAAATPAALVMMTASLIGTLAVAIAVLVRGAW